MNWLFSGLIAGLPAIAGAATINVPPGNPAVTVNLISGQFISTSAVVRVGFFTVNPGNLNCDTYVNEVNQHFVPLGEAGSPPGYGTPAGNNLRINPANFSITGAITDVTFGDGVPNTVNDGFLARGTRLVLIVRNDPNLFEMGIYSATSWLVPTSTSLNSASLPLGQVDDVFGEVYWGSLGSTSPGSAPGALVLGGVCPEPGSAGMVMLLAGFCLAGPRRRPSD